MRSTVRKFCVATTVIMRMPPSQIPRRRQANRRKCMSPAILSLFHFGRGDLDLIVSLTGRIIERRNGCGLPRWDSGIHVHAQLPYPSRQRSRILLLDIAHLDVSAEQELTG